MRTATKAKFFAVIFCAIVSALLLIEGCGDTPSSSPVQSSTPPPAPSPSPSPSPGPPPSPSPSPAPDAEQGVVVVVVEENHGYSSVIGNSAMPYFDSLATQYGLATQYYADSHPSIGNYFMMTAGQLVTRDDGFTGTVDADNIVRHLLAGGKTWKSYVESLPSPGYIGANVYPYVRTHNPLSFFTDVVNSSSQVLNLVPFSQFTADMNANQLPDLSFVVPNLLDDAHDGTLAQADVWLEHNVAPLLSNPQFQKNGLLLIVFDEAAQTDSTHGGGHVAMVAVGPLVKRGQSSTLYQHENLLKTITTYLGIDGNIGAAQNATAMSDLVP
jgi:hypothetical protein